MTIITNLQDNTSLFITCGCGSEVLNMEYSHDLKTIDMAIYENYNSFKFKLSLWNRILWCWRILFHNIIYSDQIVLNKKQIMELKNFLNSIELS